MIDLIDLMNEHFQPQVTLLDDKTHELFLKNAADDHDFYTSITREQLIILRDNAHLLYRLLADITC